MREFMLRSGIATMMLVTASCETPADPRRSGNTSAAEPVLLAEFELYFDEDGLQQTRSIRDRTSELGLSTEALSEFGYDTIAGRGVNPPDTIELVTCRPSTSPTCDTPYGAATWITPDVSAGLEGLTSDPALCGDIPAGRSSTCFAFSRELRSFRGQDVSNVILEYLNFTDGGPVDIQPYGGSAPVLGLTSPGTQYRYGTLEPAPATPNLFDPPFQAGIRDVRWSLPIGYTPTTALRVVVRAWGTFGTARAPHQVSVTNVGDETPDEATQGCITSDGDYTVFASRSPLVPEHVGTTSQIYRARRRTGVVELLSRGSDGTPGDGDSTSPCLTPNGSVVVFESVASNLVAGDTNGVMDVFTHDTATSAIALVSRANGGAIAAQCGRGGGSNRPQISDNGAVVAFASTCANLCGGQSQTTGCMPGRRQVYRFVRASSLLEGVSVRAGTSGTIDGATRWGGAGAPLSAGTHNSHMGAVNFDGARIAFVSTASGVGFLGPSATDTGTRDVFVRNATTSETIRISDDRGGAVGSRNPHLSSDGVWVVFETGSTTITGATDTNGVTDIVRCVSSGTPCGIVSAPDGTGTATANGASAHPFASSDGRFIAFESAATNLVAGDVNDVVDVFVHDFGSPGGLLVTALSHNGRGELGDGDSTRPRMTRDGTYVLFQSLAENLQDDDAGRFDEDGDVADLFVIHR